MAAIASLIGVLPCVAGTCATDAQCDDADACTFGVCVNDACELSLREYGDIDGNGVLGIDDIVCALDGFAGNFADCAASNIDIEPCVGNGVVDAFDILAAIDAADGNDACACASPDGLLPRLVYLEPAPDRGVTDDVGLTEIRIGFSEVVNVPDGVVRVWGVGGGDIVGFTTTFDYLARELVVTLASPVQAERVTLIIDDSVTDLSGNILDGDSIDPNLDVFPTGDSFPGGAAVFRINVLQGDADGNGIVDAADGDVIAASDGLCVGDPGFDPDADLDRNGCVDATDAAIHTAGLGGMLPATDGAGPEIAERSPAVDAIVRSATFSTVNVSFSEALDPARIEAGSVLAVLPDGTLQQASSLVLLDADTTAEFTFTPPLDQGGAYRLSLSNGVADVSGELLSVDAQRHWNVDLDFGPATLVASSPAFGDGDVALTRETILEFDYGLDPGTVTTDNIFVRQGGNPLIIQNLHLSSDNRRVTLFYQDDLPASATVRVTVMGDFLLDDLGNNVDADGDGAPGGTALIDFDTLSITPVIGTAVCGRVFASELSGVNEPLQDVLITVDGAEATLFTSTDSKGNFCLDPCPAGQFFVHVDGRTATNASIPAGAYYPFVGKVWNAQAGYNGVNVDDPNNVGDIYLPLVVDGSLQLVSDVADTVVGFPQAVLDANPGLPQLADVNITVPQGALFADDGTAGGRVGIAPVNPERLPGPLPQELRMPMVITVQTAGATGGDPAPTNFDIPAPVVFPNLPDPQTGVLLGPGEKTALWSFDHDLGRWRIMGPATVSEDGLLVVSDPGVGIEAPGWHGIHQGVMRPDGTIIVGGCDSSGCGVASGALTLLDCASGALGLGIAERVIGCSWSLVTGGMSTAINCVGKVNTPGCKASITGLGAGVASSCAKNAGKLVPVAGAALSCGLSIGSFWGACCVFDLQETEQRHAAYMILLEDILAYYEVLFGSDVWTHSVALSEDLASYPIPFNSGDINADAELVSAFLDALVAVSEPTSDEEERISPTESAQLLSLSLPSTILSSDVMDLIAYWNNTYDNWSVGILTHAQAGSTDFIDADLLLQAIDDVQSSAIAILEQGDSDVNLFDAFEQSLDRTLLAATSNTAEPEIPSEAYTVVVDGTNDIVYRYQLSSGGEHDPNCMAAGASLGFGFVLPETLEFGFMPVRSGAAGSQLSLPDIPVFEPSEEPDTDSDGLADLAEFVIGTNELEPDTDGDGIPDGTEIQQGTDPLDGLIVSTGIIASADTPGTAFDVCASNDAVVVADGAAGVAVFNVFNGMNPAIIAQVDTPGEARAVTCSGNTVAVADGAGGLAIIDVSDPAAAAVVHQISAGDLGGNPRAVAFANGVVFVGTDSGVVAEVELNSGAVLSSLDLTIPIDDVAVDGSWLFVLADETVYSLSVFDLPLTVVHTAASPVSSPVVNPFSGRQRLFVGGGVAYATHARGYNTIDVSDPAAMALIQATVTTAQGWIQTVANGTGLGVAVVSGVNGGAANLSLYDVSDPAQTDVFLADFATPGEARAASIYNGLAYVADGSAGLQVVNYLAYDALGIPPSLTVAVRDTNGQPAPTQVEEGSRLVIEATVNDDVQVRNVQLLVDGVVAATDGNFPFLIDYTVPAFDGGGDNFLTLAVQASDTGGNVTLETVMPDFEIVPDIFPPSVIGTSFMAGESYPPDFFNIFALSLAMSEALDPATVDAASITLLGPGPDEVFDTGDDVLFALDMSLTQADRILVINPVDVLPNTELQLRLSGTLVTDAAGNALDGDANGTGGDDYVFPFTIDDGTTIFWDGGGDGVTWFDPLNWNTDTVPASDDVVLINVPDADPLINYATNITTSIAGMICAEDFRVASSACGPCPGLTFAINGAAEFGGSLTIEGDMRLALNGDSTVDEPLIMNCCGFLSGDGIVTLNGGGSLNSANMSGSGTTVLPAGQTLTIFSSLFVVLHESRVFENHGTVLLTFAPGLDITNFAVFRNMPGGVFVSTDPGIHSVNVYNGTGIFENLGTIRVTGGGQLVANLASVYFVTTGLVDVESGIFRVNQDLSYSGDIRIAPGQTLLTQSFGCCAVTLTLDASSQLQIDFSEVGAFGKIAGGPPADQIVVGGALDIVVDAGFAPVLGQTFDIVTAGTVNGTFASVSGTDLGGGLAFEVSYLPTAVRLTVVSAP